jgi:uncharacterized protein (TIRG00374 family)
MNRQKLLNAAYCVFFMGIAVFTLYYCFKGVESDDFVAAIASADYTLVVLSVFVGVLSYFIRAVRWRMLILPLNYRPATYRVYNAVMTGYLANLTIPRIGEIVRCATLNKTDRIPVDSLFGTVVSERIIDLLCLFCSIVLAFVFKMELFTGFLVEHLFPQWQPMFANISWFSALIIIIAVLSAMAVLWLFLRWLLRKPAMHRVRGVFISLRDGLKTIFRMKRTPLFILCSVAIWVCYWLTSFLVIRALPATAAFGAADALFLMVLGSLGFVVPVPGGFGAFHTMIAWGFMMYGMEFSDGIIFATLSHESQLLGMVFFGVIALISVSVAKSRLSRIDKLK